MSALNNDGFLSDPFAPLPFAPTLLKGMPNWVSWRTTKDGDKPPFIVGTNQHASSTDSSTWTDFTTAVTKSTINGVEGVGFVIGGIAVEKEIVGIDIDGCLNPETNGIAPWAEEIVNLLDTYTERTPSGFGLRAWTIGKWPFKEHVFNIDPTAGFGDKVKIEIYNRARYFTITGDLWRKSKTTIEPRDLTTLHALCETIQSQWAPKAKAKSDSATLIGESVRIESIPTAPITTKLELLLRGEIVSTKPFVIKDGSGNSLEYPSHSEADMALCTLLALEHGDNADLVWDNYLKSSLCREKWTGDREEYFKGHTIANAITTAKRLNAKSSQADLNSPNNIADVELGICEEDAHQIEEQELPAFPRLSGLLSELSEAICPDIPYEFKIMAAITHWGLIRSGVDTLEGEPTLQPRFYTCFIKEPGYGKTAAINEIRLCMKVCANYSSPSSVDSGPALVDEFSEVRAQSLTKNIGMGISSYPARVLLDPDEMTDLFEKSKVTSQGRNSLFTEMLKLYEGNRTGNRSRKSGKSQLDDAHLAIIAGATPDGYERMWTGTGGGSTGLQSRLILISTASGMMPINRKATNSLALGEIVLQLHKAATQAPIIVRLEDDARSLMTSWWMGTDRNKPSCSRVDDMVKRLLIVTAVTSGQNTVDRRLMAEAVAFGDYIIAAREKFNPNDSYSYTQAFEDAIRRVGHRHKLPMTLNDYRRLVHPNRKPGGIGPFLQAWKNIITVGELTPDGKTVQGTVKYRF